MFWLILGVVVFFGVHLIPATKLRTQFITVIGETVYKGGFSVLSFAGLGLMVIGMSRAPTVLLWQPPSSAATATAIFMLPVFMLMTAANLTGNIKRIVRHPMSLGVLLWSLSHLLVNGTAAALVLFGSFACYALFNMRTVTSARTDIQYKTSHDIIAIVIGLTAYILLTVFHEKIFGVSAF